MSGRVTQILEELRADTPGAREALLEAVYDELKRLATSKIAGERPGHTLQPTALVHEAYLSLLGGDSDWKDRSHFFATAAKVMRQILVDAARARRALKRGGGRRRVSWREGPGTAWQPDADEVLAVHEALEKLEALDERSCRVVELRFFAGLTVAETAAVMGVSERTVYGRWEHARTWLFREIGS